MYWFLWYYLFCVLVQVPNKYWKVEMLKPVAVNKVWSSLEPQAFARVELEILFNELLGMHLQQ